MSCGLLTTLAACFGGALVRACATLAACARSDRVARRADEGCLERRPTTHTNQVVGAATCNDELITCGLDDRVVWSGAAEARSAALPCAPKSLSVSTGGVAVAATVSGVTLAQDGKVVASVALPGAAVAAVSRDGKEVAVGYADGAVRVFSRSPAGELQLRALLARHRDCVTALQFDAAGAMLASCDANREVVVWERCDADPFWAPKESLGRCVYHTARVTCLAWEPSGKRLATGGLDCNILIWDVAQPASKRETIPAAHRDGVTALTWTGSKLVSAGADACVRVWA
jgi:WD40 repeat protein